MVYPAGNGFSAGCCWLGGLDWQTNVAHRSKQELCLSPGARSRGEEGRRTRLRHEEASVARHVPDKRGGRPGNEPHSTRPDQSRQAQARSKHPCTTISTFGRLSAANKHTSVHVQTDRRTDTCRCYNIPATRYIPPWHSVLTIAVHRRVARRNSSSVGFSVCVSVCLSLSLCLSVSASASALSVESTRVNEAYMIGDPALVRYDVPCAKSLTSANDDDDHHHHHDSR